MDKLRLDRKCEQAEAERFLAAIGKLDDCMLKDFQPVTEKCHIVRYKYSLQNEKVGVLYDTKARLLSVTAPQPILEFLKKMLPSDSCAVVTDKSEPQNVVRKVEQPAQNKGNKATAQKVSAQPVQSAQGAAAGHDRQPGQKKTPSAKARQSGASVAKPTSKSESKEAAQKQDSKAAQKPTAESAEPKADGKRASGEEGQDYTVKKFAAAQLDKVLKGLKKLRGVSYRLENTVAAGTPEEVKTYLIQNKNGQKTKLRYMPGKKILQLQGKRSNLYGEVQALIAGDADFVSAVKPHVELSGARTADVQKKLKKRLPDAFEYLSEQSKIDLTIGLLDIYNNEIKLTDYSSLLTPPYRGLEKFISDLQKAQGIEVKMIGQAFDKVDGKYVLKGGYTRRIRSVIYAEVLAALYAEYFASRNFYLHADNSEDSVPRMIGDKAEVQTIFERLLDTINYNSKKLKEIGFSL